MSESSGLTVPLTGAVGEDDAEVAGASVGALVEVGAVSAAWVGDVVVEVGAVVAVGWAGGGVQAARNV